MSSVKLALNALVLHLFLGSLISAQDSAKPNAWIKKSGDKVELLFRGRVLNSEGKVERDAILQVCDHPVPLANRPRQQQVNVEMGEFQFATDGLNYLSLHASSADRTQQAVRLIASHELATVAESGKFDIQLAPARYVFIRVVDEGKPVALAKVLAQVGWASNVDAQTDSSGIAKIPIPAGEELDSIRVWTTDHRLGFIDFRDTPKMDINRTSHIVELSNCKPLKVRVIDSDGKPKPDFPIHLGVSNKEYHWVLDKGLFEGSTDAKGEATFDFFPDWEGERHFLYSADSAFFFEESKDVDGVFECKLGRNAATVTATFQFALPKGCNGGMLVEGWSFQSAQENRSTVFFARLDSEGRMQAEIVPGYTYNLFTNDANWVSKPVAAVLVDADSKRPVLPHFEIVVGEQVELTVTAGPDHRPIGKQWINLETSHRFEWKENGKTRSGNGGRRWLALTNPEGKVVTRAFPGKFEARVSDGSSNVEKTMEVVVGAVNRLELHREVAVPTSVMGKLVALDAEVDLKGAAIVLDQADSSFIKPQVKAFSNDEGAFEASLDCSRAVAFATTADGRFSGAKLIRVLDKEFEIPMLEVGVVSGQVLDEKGLPISGGEVFASATMKPGEKPADAGDNWPLSLSVVRFTMKTDANGFFKFDQLPAGFPVLIGIKTEDMEKHTFRLLDEVFLEAGERRENKAHRPPSKTKKNIEERYSHFVRNCELSHTHGLIVLGGAESGVELLRQQSLDDVDCPDVLWYLLFTVGLAEKDSETTEWLAKKPWATTKPNELRLVVVDGSGTELGQLSLQVPETTAAKQANREQSIAFLAKHRIEQQDAREKLTGAIEEARASKRRVWAKVGGTRCGPCIQMSNWMENHRGFIEKAFVLVDIDADRDLHGKEIAQQLEHQGGIPWHVMLNDQGEILATSESPIGNIGMPDSSIESQKHIRKMFADAASDLLTSEEIDTLLETLK